MLNSPSERIQIKKKMRYIKTCLRKKGAKIKKPEQRIIQPERYDHGKRGYRIRQRANRRPYRPRNAGVCEFDSGGQEWQDYLHVCIHNGCMVLYMGVCVFERERGVKRRRSCKLFNGQSDGRLGVNFGYFTRNL